MRMIYASGTTVTTLENEFVYPVENLVEHLLHEVDHPGHGLDYELTVKTNDGLSARERLTKGNDERTYYVGKIPAIIHLRRLPRADEPRGTDGVRLRA